MSKPMRDLIIDAAIKAGKIPAAERDAYAKHYDANPKAYGHLLSAAVEQGGMAPGVHNNGRVSGAEEYDTRFLSPGERQRVEAARQAAPKPRATSRLANAPTQEVGRADYDATHLSPAERETIAAAQAGRQAPGIIAGDAVGGLPARRGES